MEVARYALRTFKINRMALPDGTDVEYFRSISVKGRHWDNGTCTAKCIGGPFSFDEDGYIINHHHEPPDLGCSCGIYGCLTLEDLVFQYPHYAGEAVAVIAAEGPTVIGRIGLRTARARVIAYWTEWPRTKELCANQFSGAAQYDDMLAMLKEYKLPVQTNAWNPGEVDRAYFRTIYEGTGTIVDDYRFSGRPQWWGEIALDR